ncbi:hypothetical protein KGF54_002251 [Candida jiufengensis]|uniref:uncharacterized protein n=1 Tax=Candida jiufengensis TaxID=497108 RepID=UPI0022240AD9|nr:uncharacterized protein KGF54_002251 [Candida jiufengensis]KAI5954476.1 hypothetical protein KGF54_002251 [Candida jiufengensis]
MFNIIKINILLLVLLLQLFVNADTSSFFQNVTQPTLNYNSFGNRIGFFGSFISTSFYKYIGSSQFLTTNSNQAEEEDSNANSKRDDNISQSSNQNNLFLQDTNNNFISKFGNLNGPISQLLRISDDSIILNGNFTEFNSQSVKSPIIYNITSNSTTNIIPNNGFNGTVKTIFIDKELIYLGGNFTFNNTIGVAIYNQTSKNLNSTLFQGFGNDSTINSIIKVGGNDTDNGSIIFGGNFNTLGLSDLLVHNITSNSTSNHNETNSTIVNAEQVISLRHGIFTSVNAQDEGENSKIICPSTNNIWDATPNSGAEWKVELPDEMKGITPTKARIYLPESDNGIKLFRIYSFPNNGIMNLTYIDPSTNELAYCDAWCPLNSFDDLNEFVDKNRDNATDLNQDDVFVDEEDGTFFKYYDPSTKTKNLGYGANFQEFAFINQIGFDQLGLTILDWYGNQASFSGFELYQNAITVYGNNTLNEPNCDDDFNKENNNYADIISGNFQSIKAIDPQLTGNDYLVTYDTNAKIVLYPNISYSGDYSIIMTTPGCSQDNSCQQRGIVNVTLTDIDENILSSKLIYQNNENAKFDYLFYGHLNSSSQGHNNKIEVSFHDTIISGEQNPMIVVDKVTANIVSLDSYYDRNNTNRTSNRNGSELVYINLNGLFEYSLANFTDFDENLVHYRENNRTLINTNNTYVGNSSINLLSGRISNDSEVREINLFDDSLSFFGQFESNSNNLTLSNNNLITLNISSYNSTSNETNVNLPTTLRKRDDQTIHGATFNNTISKTITVKNSLLVLGKFSISDSSIKNLSNNNGTTSQANNFALYSNNQWYSFGNSFEDVEYDQFANPTIDKIEYYIFSSSSGSNFKTWDNTNAKWSTNQYNLTQSLPLNSQQQILGGSSFNIMEFNSINQAYIANAEFNKFGFNVTENSSDFISNSFYVNDSISIIGGKFTSGDVRNVGIINNTDPSSSIKALQGNEVVWDDQTEIETLYVDNDSEYLFMGIHGSIEINNNNLTGIIIYDLINDTFTSFQPPALSKSDGSSIHVNSVVLFDEGHKLLVGGDFDTAGSLSCPSLCVYDISNTRWINPQNDASTTQNIGGVITDMKFYTANHVLITGKNLTLNNDNIKFMTYNFNNGEFDTSDSLNKLNKDVNKFIINDRSSNSNLNNRMVVIGDEYVSGFDGTNWYSIDQDLNIDNTTNFNDLKLLTAEKSTSYNKSLFDNDKLLIVAGIFSIKDYGLVNMALYNGTSWIPYVYTLQQQQNQTTTPQIGDVKTILINDQNRFLSSDDLKNLNKNLSKGKVVGISLACALGSTTLFGLLYIIPYFALLKNRKGYVQRIHEQDMMDAVNPEDLLHEIDLQREK